jgi:hypothetical protein
MRLGCPPNQISWPVPGPRLAQVQDRGKRGHKLRRRRRHRRLFPVPLQRARGSVSRTEKRIDDVMAQMKAAAEKAKQAADAARKASASASFYLFFSMLIGAFIASAAGAIGGRQRDLV